MKKVVFLLFLVASTAVMAQTGYVRSQGLLMAMPETATANKSLNELGAKLEAEVTKAEQNAATKMRSLEYKAQDPELSQAVRQDLASQAATLNQELNKVKQNAQMELQKKEAELMEPITTKLTQAIEKIAKARGYKMVVDISAVSYAEKELDITLDVSKELGIAPKEQ